MSFFRSLLPSRLRLPTTARYLATTAEASTSTSAPAETPSEATEPAKFTPFTQRAGLLARKRGMTALWDQDGRRWPVTVLQVQECQVIQHSPPHESSPQYHGLQIGAKNKDWDKVTSFMKGHFRSKGNGVTPKYRLKEFQVTEDAVMPVGSWLSAAHFVPGQYVDVRAKTIGKGFQGVMKRFGWRGQSASHGTSLKHRSPGAIGANQDPGRVWKGKKMAGRMGGKFRTTQNLLVHRIDLALNLIYVRGHVPGVDDQYIQVSDAIRKVKWKAEDGFRAGKDADSWLEEGVTGLPVPGVTLEDVKKGDWPEIVEWPGLGKAADK